MARICLLTPTQPSVNPRIVKEADALAEAGYEVHVLCGHTVAWADHSDRELLQTKKWRCSYVAGDPGSARYHWTRFRHGVISRLANGCNVNSYWGKFAFARITPELQAAAFQLKADLYIAHYVGALVAAEAAARKHGALLAFDAEDLESGYWEFHTGPRPIDLLIEQVERQYLSQCCYVTAASPGIATAYASKYGIRTPVDILNVFSLPERPDQFRDTRARGALKLYWFSQTVGPDRGLDDVINAMAILRGCEIELHLRGRCASGVREGLLHLAYQRGVDPATIHFLPPAPAREMITISAEYDVGLALEQPISPNRDLCLTNKIFSYLLAGNAVAATSTAGQRPIVETLGTAGFLYKPGDAEALARGLRLWHDNRSELQRARRESWLLGTHKFNWDLEKNKLLGAVSAVLMPQDSKNGRSESAVA